MIRKVNYRKYYEICTGEKIERGFDIHHLDSNRENNHIMNLVAVPYKVHRDYHNAEFALSKVLCDLNNLRSFHTSNTIKYHEIINQYITARNDIYHYELRRDDLIYKNNPQINVYENSTGLKEVERIIKKYNQNG